MIDPAYSRVLVIEDRVDTYWIVHELLLHSVGVRSCQRCANEYDLSALLDSAAIGPIDLVLYNIKRPLSYAFALLPVLRQHIKLFDARIVALTAHIMPDDVERVREAGFDGFIGIPIDQARFPTQIRRLFNDEVVWEPR